MNLIVIFFTFHAGITTDPPKLGVRLPRKKIANRNLSLTTFFENTRIISDYAKDRGVKIAMELNVVQKFNLDNGKNRLALFAEYAEVELFFKHFKKNEVGILLDLAHTIVTSYWLKFDKNNFIKKLQDKITVVHISNNNGLQDQNLSLTSECWPVSKLKLFKHKPIALESMNLDVNEIKSNIDIINNAIK